MAAFPEKTVYDSEVNDQYESTTKITVERPVLIVLDGSHADQRFSLDKREMTIGRELMMNDIALDDPRASRRHVRLTYTNFEQIGETPELVIEDLNSTNGIFVNGQKALRHQLRNRDKILIGSTMLGFFLKDESEVLADEKLYRLANHDALTGLYNRGMFNNELQREFDRSKRYKREMGLVLFDIDHFKRFNDTYGHQVGDQVLVEIGRQAMANTRSNDFAARYGGEEFAFILPETSLGGAFVQAERMRQSVNKLRIVHQGQALHVSVSLGVAAMEDDLHDQDAMIRRADVALYHAKQNGRDCVCWSREGKLTIGKEVT